MPCRGRLRRDSNNDSQRDSFDSGNDSDTHTTPGKSKLVLTLNDSDSIGLNHIYNIIMYYVYNPIYEIMYNVMRDSVYDHDIIIYDII